MKTMLVIGAQTDSSLGGLVTAVAHGAGWQVHTVGISGNEQHELDITNGARVAGFFDEWCRADPPPEAVVCTAGINLANSLLNGNTVRAMQRQWEVNALGPIRVLEQWVKWWMHGFKAVGGYHPTQAPLHFVAISSNSAQVARSKSMGYCASKAALSMAIRCAAREMADTPLNIYSYEPGWLDGTPMSANVEDRMRRVGRLGEPSGPVGPLHRIPGNRVVVPELLASMIVNGMEYTRSPLNGCTIRIDGGEQ